MERLQKVMAHAGVASRRKSEEIITEGRVKVNGEIVTELGTKVNPDQDVVEVDGEIITKEKRIYILLHKPEGYITTVDDPRGRATVLDLIDDVKQRIYPVGRLDFDTSGLLILTNDGELTYILTHPSYEIDKTYLTRIDDRVSDQELKRLEKGIELEDGLTAPGEVVLKQRSEDQTVFELTIHEGRNRQVRRMCKKLEYEVKELKRIRFGPFTLKGLKPGGYRFLTKEEISALQELKSE